MATHIQEEISYYTYPTPILWKKSMLPIYQNLEANLFPSIWRMQAMQYCTGSVTSPPKIAQHSNRMVQGNLHSVYLQILHRGGAPTTDTELEDENDENKGGSSSNDSNSSGGSKRPSLNRNDKTNKKDDDDEDSFWNSCQWFVWQ